MLCSLSCADLVLIKAQNTVNPFGLTSILTKSKGKSATINRGSDYYRYPTIKVKNITKNVSEDEIEKIQLKAKYLLNIKNAFAVIILLTARTREVRWNYMN